MGTEVGSKGAGVTPAALPPRTARHLTSHRQRAIAHAGGRLLHGAERAFAIFAVLALSGSLSGLLRRGPTALEGVGDKLRVATLLPIFLLAIGILFAQWSRSLRAAVRNPSVILLLALAGTSYLWSEAPRLTLWRAGILFGTSAFGVYLAVRFSPRELIRLLAFAFGIVAVLSVLYALFLPQYGISSLHPGAWEGIYYHKNALGLYAGLGTIVFALVAWDSGPGRWVAAIGAGLCGVLVLLSRSSTGLVLVFAALPLLPLGEAMRRRSSFVVALAPLAMVLLGGAAMWAVENQGSIYGWLGRDPTLSGRTALWTVLLDAVGRRPWLGYGYNAFWVGWGGESAEVWSAIGWNPAHAHNGFLDLALQLGVIGVLTFIAGLGLAVAQALRALWRSNSADGIWPIVFLVIFVLVNLTESSLLRHDSLIWALYVATVSAPLLERARYHPPGRSSSPARLSFAARRWLRPATSGIRPRIQTRGVSSRR